MARSFAGMQTVSRPASSPVARQDVSDFGRQSSDLGPQPLAAASSPVESSVVSLTDNGISIDFGQETDIPPSVRALAQEVRTLGDARDLIDKLRRTTDGLHPAVSDMVSQVRQLIMEYGPIDWENRSITINGSRGRMPQDVVEAVAEIDTQLKNSQLHDVALSLVKLSRLDGIRSHEDRALRVHQAMAQLRERMARKTASCLNLGRSWMHSGD
jgi:hypothetical protein